MTNLQKIKSLIETVEYHQAHCECMDKENVKNPFITISREAAAGGHMLAEMIVKKMAQQKDPLFRNWHVCDQEICERLVKEPGLSITVEKWLREEYQPELVDMFEQMIVHTSPQDLVVKKMFEIIRSLAKIGKLIVVGRAGAMITKDMPLGTHIRLVAPLDVRIERMRKRLDVTREEVKTIIEGQDRARAKLVNKFFSKQVESPLLYDAVWNTSRTSIETIAELTVELVKSRACLCGKKQILL